MRIIFIVLLLCITAGHSLRAQDVPGCMDPASPDYVENATISDGSCGYPDGSAALLNSRIATLPDDLQEISGMIYWNGKLYGHEDSGNDPIIYEMDAATGVISKRITLEVSTVNMDWEDITQDDNYIYVGDFGNNSGTRQNLRIFRVAKSLITTITGESGTIAAADIATINFTYSDQADFTPHLNTTPFDCEAMIYHDGNLHLFTKGWDGNGTKHYILPATPGTQEATYLESLDTENFRITSVTKANNNAVILLGYETEYSINPLILPKVAIWVISGFNDYNTIIETGNKRKIDLGLIANTLTTGIGQAEAITATSQTMVLISSEHFAITEPLPVTINQGLFELNTEQWMPLYILPFGITNFTSRLSNNQVALTWEYSGQGVAYFEVEAAGQANGTYRSIGKVYDAGNTSSLFSFTDKEPLVSAQRFYRIRIVSPDGKHTYSKTLAVSDSSNTQFNLTVAPNPFSDKVDISFYSDKRQTVQFSIMDMHGRTIMLKQLQCTPGRYSYMMDGLQGLSSGVYFLTARTPGNNYVRKIVR
ncbi:T9SS type A sorting domain-containing protein [Agriterribacter sp.]|uniref:T9SS type A sorting domain-containing protein n=1 Tax=Agriterribacter sp. TaxID=2821509 RepID=UPI002B9A2C63|nr:T9SS type A sorting domain-containing protein [Agriterribacter sp.]HRO44867.1 T9SS type A sorting domain-containing protein [Agriterribacter sp.]HRQ15605.1 T9SS type A sorting domain-containing protein [Agriterribacter sp.]